MVKKRVGLSAMVDGFKDGLNSKIEIQAEPEPETGSEKLVKVKRSYMFIEDTADMILKLKAKAYKRKDYSEIVAMAIEEFYYKHFPEEKEELK